MILTYGCISSTIPRDFTFLMVRLTYTSKGIYFINNFRVGYVWNGLCLTSRALVLLSCKPQVMHDFNLFKHLGLGKKTESPRILVGEVTKSQNEGFFCLGIYLLGWHSLHGRMLWSVCLPGDSSRAQTSSPILGGHEHTPPWGSGPLGYLNHPKKVTAWITR